MVVWTEGNGCEPISLLAGTKGLAGDGIPFDVVDFYGPESTTKAGELGYKAHVGFLCLGRLAAGAHRSALGRLVGLNNPVHFIFGKLQVQKVFQDMAELMHEVFHHLPLAFLVRAGRGRAPVIHHKAFVIEDGLNVRKNKGLIGFQVDGCFPFALDGSSEVGRKPGQTFNAGNLDLEVRHGFSSGQK
jgi:hypothetical protein